MVAILGIIFFQGGNVRAIGEKDVRPPVAVVVEDGRPAGHRFRGVASLGFAVFQTDGESSQLKANGAGGLGMQHKRSYCQKTGTKAEGFMHLRKGKGVAEATPKIVSDQLRLEVVLQGKGYLS